MSLQNALENYFAFGFRGTQNQLAARFATSPGSIRGTISVLRSRGVQIGKVLPAGSKIAVYQLAADYTAPRLGRPAYRFSVRGA